MFAMMNEAYFASGNTEGNAGAGDAPNPQLKALLVGYAQAELPAAAEGHPEAVVVAAHMRHDLVRSSYSSQAACVCSLCAIYR